jgi:hypothetical protein
MPTSAWKVSPMMRWPPAEPTDSTSLRSRSSTKVGDIDERGRLPGSTRLRHRLAGDSGTTEKSVSSLLSRKPPTMMCEPNGALDGWW